MVRYITSHKEFIDLLDQRRKLICDNVTLPERVFKREYRFFRVMDDVSPLADWFLGPIMNLSKELGYEEFAAMMINPDPEDYYYYHFNKYGVFIFNCNDSYDDIANIRMQPPPENQADAFEFIVNSYALFPICSEMPEWCVYRDRLHCEAGILAFKNEDVLNKFMKIDKEKVTVEAHEAIATFMNQFWPNDGVPIPFKDEFLRNYANDKKNT